MHAIWFGSGSSRDSISKNYFEQLLKHHNWLRGKIPLFGIFNEENYIMANLNCNQKQFLRAFLKKLEEITAKFEFFVESSKL